jgi:hypothetical protein
VRKRLKGFPPKPVSLKDAWTFLVDSGCGKNRLAVARHALLLAKRVFNVTLAVFLFSRAAKVFADANPADCWRTGIHRRIGFSNEVATL